MEADEKPARGPEEWQRPFEESAAVGMRATHQQSGAQKALESATAQEKEKQDG